MEVTKWQTEHGTVDGWVAGAELVFRAKVSSGDYHNEMNIPHFMEWWKT